MVRVISPAAVVHRLEAEQGVVPIHHQPEVGCLAVVTVRKQSHRLATAKPAHVSTKHHPSIQHIKSGHQRSVSGTLSEWLFTGGLIVAQDWILAVQIVYLVGRPIIGGSLVTYS